MLNFIAFLLVIALFASPCLAERFSVYGPNGNTHGQVTPGGNLWAVGPDSVVIGSRNHSSSTLLDMGGSPGESESQTMRDTIKAMEFGERGHRSGLFEEED